MSEKTNDSRIAVIKEEINRQLGDTETLKSLLDTTFKGLQAPVMKRALLEGMMRGFSFQDFLEGNVYAIPFKEGYSLVTSIDYSRKIAQRSGIIGSPKQDWEFGNGGKVISCTATVQKKVGDTIGDFSSTVFFEEYTTNKNLWISKPRHMIGKVAEAHALRKAFPEELAKSYIEEELQNTATASAPVIDLDAFRSQIKDCKTKEELERVWADIPGPAKVVLKSDMEEVKAMIISESKDIV